MYFKERPARKSRRRFRRNEEYNERRSEMKEGEDFVAQTQERWGNGMMSYMRHNVGGILVNKSYCSKIYMKRCQMDAASV